MIVFGIREKRTGFKIVAGHSCCNCSSKESLFVQVIKKGFYLSGLRVFTLSGKICTVCAHCQHQLEECQMPPDLKKNAMAAARADASSKRYSICLFLFRLFVAVAVVNYHQ
ncbi:hypothetical protein A8C56_03650 [Niabella ginsenosidivorans]|uniref:Uncharacterized protein n=1 Tax=Niabella ginsenosidivorans TaxID=1176587 RepID=A0A1A9I0V8_9BACT|nr:hypothetical protein [Niabella ginsenosidivorans]ANH80194.1 hypothetical protein A8C56_03650 [Niabella ginsenosidivorans]